MKNTRLVYFMQRLSAEELEGFGHYVRSPLFNEREALVRLYEIIRSDLLGEQEAITREEVYAYMFPGQDFKPGSFKAMFSRLFRLLKDYLIYLELKEDPAIQQRLFLRRINGLDAPLFPVFHKTFREGLEKLDLNASDYYLERLFYEEEWDRYQMRQGKRMERGLMETSVRCLGLAFTIRLLRYQLRKLSFSQTYPQSVQYFLELPLAQYFPDPQEPMPPVVQVYCSLLASLTPPVRPEKFEETRHLVKTHLDDIPPLDLTEIYTSIINAGVRQINQGQLGFRAEVFQVFKDMLDLQLLASNDRLPVHHFRNIMGLALRLGEIQWATQFMLDWTGRISEDHADNALQFCRGLLAFYQKDFPRAETHFNRVLDDFQDLFYSLNARGLLIMVHYETRNETGLDALLSSYRMYLHRLKHLTSARKQQYIHFANHLRRLVACAPGDHRRLDRLRQDILEHKPTGLGKEWLLEKIRELRGDEGAT